jgi:hypothetical protein
LKIFARNLGGQFESELGGQFNRCVQNCGQPEIITLDDFVTIIERLKVLKQFNTSSAKESFKGTKIYKKRSPFFALLLSSGVIERVT